MSQAFNPHSNNRPLWLLRRAIWATLLLGFCCPSLNAQMAPIQLTNPTIDTVHSDKMAAWVADENLGVLYCELIEAEPAKSKRVVCFDSNGVVTPTGSAIFRER